ncbi:NADH-ubiquinone oxidoreductase chain 4L, partial [Mucuna pruriens]
MVAAADSAIGLAIFFKLSESKVFRESFFIDKIFLFVSIVAVGDSATGLAISFRTFQVQVVNSNLLIFFVSSDDVMGQAFASLVSMVAAMDSAIGLAIFFTTFRVQGTIISVLLKFRAFLESGKILLLGIQGITLYRQNIYILSMPIELML